MEIDVMRVVSRTVQGSSEKGGSNLLVDYSIDVPLGCELDAATLASSLASTSDTIAALVGCAIHASKSGGCAGAVLRGFVLQSHCTMRETGGVASAAL